VRDRSRSRTDDPIPDEHVHTPGGMTDPRGEPRPDDAADIASTDMDPSPSAPNEPPPAVPDVAKQEQQKSELHTHPADADAAGDRRLADELDELRDRHLRLGAEFDNYRKRVTRERAELGDRAQAAFAGRLLDVLDDVDRLVVQAEQGGSLEAVREGLVLVDRKLRKELESVGLERIDPAGKPFNPEEHEAVSVVAAPSADDEHNVSATFQTGYRFKGILVRPARVQVYSGEGQA
jgi:molecular chaperone GrpE